MKTFLLILILFAVVISMTAIVNDLPVVALLALSFGLLTSVLLNQTNNNGKPPQ